jgi:hypothetical protein
MDHRLWGARVQQQSRRHLRRSGRSVEKDSRRVCGCDLSGEDEEKLAKRYTKDAEAYQLYLKGRYFWNKRNEEGFATASTTSNAPKRRIRPSHSHSQDWRIHTHCFATSA